MGALYLIVGITLAGVAIDLFSKLFDEDEVGTYDYHFAMGVGAVFGER